MNKELQDKYILADTCFVSNTFFHTDNFEKFWDFLDKINCVPCINQFIYLEFIRIARSKSEKEEIKKFLTDRFFFLSLDNEIYKTSINISPLYNFCSSVQSKKQVSIPDILNVVFLKKYGNNLFLITLDHKDYPLEFLERTLVGSIDIGKDIITWGIYKFAEDNYQKLLKHYNVK